MATADKCSRRVLWIANTFPPVGGMQGLRSRRYLEELARIEPDVAVDVLTIRPSRRVPQYDSTLAEGLPSIVTVHRFRPGMLYRLRHRSKLDQWIPSCHGKRRTVIQIAISASNLTWIPRAGFWLLLRRRRRYNAVYVFVDPFASLILGLLASALNPGARLVLDYGDPKAPARDSVAPARWAAAKLERYALKRSYTATFRAPGAIRLYRAAYPQVPADRYNLNYGGVDWAAYDAISPTSDKSSFSIVYTGTIYPDTIDILPFFEAVAHLAACPGEAVRVLLAGAANPTITQVIHELGLADAVVILGHIPTDRVVSIQRSASLLLAFGLWNECKISSKLAEYIAARIPILYIAESPDDAGAELISKRRRGIVVPNNSNAIAETIRDLRISWERDEFWRRFDLSRSQEFSWEAGASHLISWLTGSETELTDK